MAVGTLWPHIYSKNIVMNYRHQSYLKQAVPISVLVRRKNKRQKQKPKEYDKRKRKMAKAQRRSSFYGLFFRFKWAGEYLISFLEMHRGHFISLVTFNIPTDF